MAVNLGLLFHLTDVAEATFLRCMTTNNKNPEHPDYKCTFNYEFLDDTYSSWSEHGSSEGSGSGERERERERERETERERQRERDE